MFDTVTEPPFEARQEAEPPWSREMEQALLGALLIDNPALAVVSDLLTPSSFYLYEHRAIFAAIAELVAARQAADVVTVWEKLKALQIDDEGVADLKYLNDLVQCVPSSRNVRLYAERVAERCAERELLASLDTAARIGRDDKLTLDTRFERIGQELRRAEQLRKSPSGSRVPMLSLTALRQAAAAVSWLVKHVVPADSVGMLFGGSGTFKSFIALDAALHVTHGLPWMGRKTTRGQVIYIAAEGGAGLWQRINAWHRARNLDPADAAMHVVPVAVDLTVDAWRVVEAAQMAGVEPALVVVDTLSQTYSGEENSANEMALYLRELGSRFRALWHCSVLLVHHSGHQATERPRGSSAIRANLDFLLGVFRDEKEMLATVSCVKQKDGELFEDAMFQLTVHELGFDADNDKITSLVARHLGTQDDVQAALESEAAAGRAGRQSVFLSLVQNGMAEKELRKLFYDTLVDLDADARRKAYGRARKQAEQRGEIEVAEGYILDLRSMRKRGA
jgi:hypothetical protein